VSPMQLLLEGDAEAEAAERIAQAKLRRDAAEVQLVERHVVEELSRWDATRADSGALDAGGISIQHVMKMVQPERFGADDQVLRDLMQEAYNDYSQAQARSMLQNRWADLQECAQTKDAVTDCLHGDQRVREEESRIGHEFSFVRYRIYEGQDLDRDGATVKETLVDARMARASAAAKLTGGCRRSRGIPDGEIRVAESEACLRRPPPPETAGARGAVAQLHCVLTGPKKREVHSKETLSVVAEPKIECVGVEPSEAVNPGSHMCREASELSRIANITEFRSLMDVDGHRAFDFPTKQSMVP
ncbi:unnamed protein product, partial [Prorocentrum cordatum]